MTAQETENQAGGADTTGADSVAGEATGNDTSATVDAGADAESTGTTPAEPAGSDASLNEAQSEPQPDAPPTPRDKLHDDAVKFIIAARLQGIDAAEFVKAKMEEIAD